MKKHIFKYLTLVSTLFSAALVFFHWFIIEIPGLAAEGHSFVTIPSLLEDAAGIVTGYAGKSSAITIIVLGGVLEYLCVLSAGLSVFGIWKSCIKEKKSRVIFSAQLISLGLVLLAGVIIVGANLLMKSVLGIADTIMPTKWIILSALSSVLSLVFLKLYNREL